MIRFLLAALTAALFLILGIPVLIIEWIIGKFNKDFEDRSSLALVKGVLRLITFFCGVKLDVYGEEKIPEEMPVLYIGNHLSIFDVILTYPLCKGLTGYISKDSLKKVPLLKNWMERLYCLFLDRSDPREGMKMILKAIEYVKSGISIFIFPEGTRSRDGKLGEFKAGSFKIAKKTNCPIVPVCITNSQAVLEHMPFVRSKHVIITYLDPIVLGDLDPEEQKHIGTYVQNKIAKQLEMDAKRI